jgi:hypothetical protein
LADLNVESLNLDPPRKNRAFSRSHVESTTPATQRIERPPDPPSRFLVYSQAKLAAWRSQDTVITHATLSASLPSGRSTVLSWRALADITQLFYRERVFAGSFTARSSAQVSTVTGLDGDVLPERTHAA